MKKCLISIPTYNRLSFTKRCVQGVLDTVDPELYDLIITDDCSTDGTQDWLRDLKQSHPEISINLFKEWVPGVVKILNFNLLRRGYAQHWVSMDNDVVHIQDGWLNKILDIFTEDGGIGFISVKPTDVDARQEVFPIHNKYPIELTWCLPNTTSVIRYEAMNDIGLYCESYPWTGFDYDIAARIYKLGYITGYYCTKRTNSNDYIEALNLGRGLLESNERLGYSQEVNDFLKLAEHESSILLQSRLPWIQVECEFINENKTCMTEFNNYEEL